MKIRAITLDNVRRFTQPVTVGPIGDGVTLLCQPNESGKSTLFDALHALFFVKYSGWPAEIKNLQPHSGGKVSVSVDLDIDGVPWRVRKQWQKGSGGEARAWQNGTLRHQGDDAEHWLGDLVRGDGTGPSGLLWVRQGQVSLSVDGNYAAKDSKGDAHEQRRNLLTLITGAMDDLTGGKTMDTALDTCLAELGALLTPTGLAKAGGALARAQALVKSLAEDETRLATQADELHEALAERRRLRAELASLDDAESRSRHIAELAGAEAAFKDAERHAALVSQAATEAALARQTHDAAFAEAKAADERRAEFRKAQELANTEQTAATTAATKLAEAEATWENARTDLASAETADKRARETVQQVSRRDAAAAAGAERQRLVKVLEQAEAAERRAAEAKAEAGRGPQDAEVKRIESLARSLDTARAVREAAGPKLVIRYQSGAAKVRLNGAEIEDNAAHFLTGPTRLELPGIGDLAITPQDDSTADPVRKAEDALSQVLEKAGFANLPALRAAAEDRAEALRMAQLAQQEVATLAADGVQALRNELARLPLSVAADDSPLPDRATAEIAADRAAETLVQTREIEVAARARRDTTKDNATEARTRATAARERHERAALAIANLAAEDSTAKTTRLGALRMAADTAAAHHLTCREAAPNVKAAESRLTRIRGVIEQTKSAAEAARLHLARLGVRIETRAGEGVEEALQDTRLRLIDAQDQLDRITFETDVLRRLSTALQAAQSAARDRYYAPIASELRPLLEQLWDDAELVWSDDTLLPSDMIRKGEKEPIDTLSGGTQEQIAFLVRLAFARLLAKGGHHAPLILDDALVYSDDDRIERLFNALHASADDLQIIVLSCRQRAFRDLGAPEVHFTKSQRETV